MKTVYADHKFFPRLTRSLVLYLSDYKKKDIFKKHLSIYLNTVLTILVVSIAIAVLGFFIL